VFQVIEISLADTRRLYQYHQTCSLELNFGLKGFDYGWLLGCREWQAGEKVLDVGGAYSPVPIHIQKTWACETWVADDFGMDSGDPFWTRQRSPQSHIQENPQVKYVLERVGDPGHSSLPQGYFDVVYSLSVMEHVPPQFQAAAWQHMASLLKPGGVLIHAIDAAYPSNSGLRKVLASLAFDTLPALVPAKTRINHFLATPRNYTRLVFQALGIHHPIPRGLDVLNMVLNPEVLAECYEHGYNRVVKDKIKNYHYQRVASLLIRLQKV
jgi:SAM-dependent methyltransferase